MNYIGIDVGDGESSVCVLPENSQIEPRPVKITGKESFLSAVSLDAQGQPVIGMDAVGRGASQGLSVRFKSQFLSGGEKARGDMRRFLAGLHGEMEKEGLFQKPYEIAVGCPAGWNGDARAQYRSLLEEAGFQSPHIVSESRAAFLYAKHARTIQMDPALIESSALVIDIGSSTLDFAYVVDGCESNVGTFGDVYLGGGAIDEAILQAAVKEAERQSEILSVFREAPEWRSYCLLAARRLKEEFFTRQSQGEGDARFSETVMLNYDRPLPLKLWVNGQLMWRIVNLGIEALHGLSFYQMLKNALDEAYEKTLARPPRLVLLTGGASRMRFFQELCRKRFPQAVFILCEEPEYSIAKGLAYSLWVDKNIQAFNGAIQSYLREDHIHQAVQDHMDSLISVVSDYMTDISFQETKKHIVDWQSGAFGKLSDMNAVAQAGIAERLGSPSVRQELMKMVENELAASCAQLQPQLDEISARYRVPAGIMQLSGVELLSDSLPGAAPKPDVEALQKAVQVLITGIVTVIVLQIPGIQIIPVILAAAAAILGKSLIASFTENVNIPLFLRKLIPVEQIANEKFREKLRKSFREELGRTSSFQDCVSSNMEKVINDYVAHMARNYEIRITGKEEA